MQALSRFLSLFKAKENPPTADTDEVYPLFFLDNLSTGRVIVLSEALRFDAVLDPIKLRDGLTRLIQQGDWRKLGGRLRQRPDGTLELYVPKEFTQERPAVRFTNQVFDVAIEEHKLGRQFPKPTEDPSLQTGPTSFEQFNTIPNGPTSLKDYLSGDHAILGLHITSFQNATIVAVVWPHAVAGALGIKEIFAAWSKALQGEEHVPRLLGARKDVLDGVGADADPKVQYNPGSGEIKGWGFARFFLRLVWTVLWRPKVEARAIFLPHLFISQLRATSMKEVEAVHGGKDSSFISEGDVLTAWTSRFVAQARGGKRPGLIFNPLDITSRLTGPWQAGGVYVQNLAGAMYTTVTADELRKKPIGELAYAIRRSIKHQATDEQIRAQLRIFRSLGHTNPEPLYGNPGSQLVAYSNWTKFDMFNAVDFSPAVSSVSVSGAGGAQSGKPVYMHCVSLGENRFQRDCFVISKGYHGNYWITAFLYPEDWRSLEDYIKQTWQRIST
ncbi:hypothetical protein GQ53DRAFT_688778 [Thozetella sp. PMI_491]|nr:hypothetical protein GQ53DRAFT_688778 [Thozetella sp. PMI_491]